MTPAHQALLDDPERASSIAEKGHARAHSEFTMEREAARIREVYEALWAANSRK